MIPGLTPEQTRRFLSDVIEIHELVRTQAKKKDRAEALSFLPVAAANGYLFAMPIGQRIVAMAIAGPVNKPEGLHNFTQEGTLLFCQFALIHPDFRRLKALHKIVPAMIGLGHSRFPWTEKLVYYRAGRYLEKTLPIDDRSEPWAEDPPSDTDTERTRLSESSRSLMKGH